MTITAGKAIADENAYVGLVSANADVKLEEKNGGLFVIPTGFTTVAIPEAVATQIDYTVSEGVISASADKKAKVDAACENSKNN